jgi:osmotically-inducible protein OsmY
MQYPKPLGENMAKIILSVLAVLLSTGILQGCAGVVVGGAAATATAAHDRRTLGVFVEDQSIEFKAAEKLAADTELKELSKINVTSYNMMVLMTGQTANQQLKSRAERLVAGVERVRRVVNELEIGSTASLGERTRDAALTAEIKFRLTQIDIPGFDPSRVKVVTERGVVYLMGLLTQAEGSAVSELVRQVSGVCRVVKVFEYISS